MKRSMVLLLALLMSACVAMSQTIVVTDNLTFSVSGASSCQLKLAAGDSAVGIPLLYSSGTYPQLLGHFPDSIRVTTYVTADSTHRTMIRFKAAQTYGAIVGTYTSVLVDSNNAATKVASFSRKTITASYYNTYDVVGVSLLVPSTAGAANTIGAVMKANASRCYARIERWFTL